MIFFRKSVDMKTIDILGENYFGSWNETRTACRAVVIKDGKMLLSYETATDQWMVPGGGIEEDETDAECCVREVEEETGFIVKPTERFLEIDEYYENFKWVNIYFVCTVTGSGKISLTEREISVGMEPRWLPLEEITKIFSMHRSYADTDEMRRGMYLREYTALCEFKQCH